MKERLMETTHVPYVIAITDHVTFSERMSEGKTQMEHIQDLLLEGKPKVISFGKKYEFSIEVEEKVVKVESTLQDITFPHILCEYVLFTKLDKDTLEELNRDEYEFPETLNMQYHISALRDSPLVTSTVREVLYFPCTYTLYNCHLYELTKEQVIDHGLKDYFELEYANHKT